MKIGGVIMKKRLILLFTLVVLLISTAACGGQKESENTSDKNETTIKVGSKNFTESLILGEIYSLALEEAGYKVERKLNLGGTMVAHTALKEGEIDMYPEYTGTGLINILQEKPMSDPQKVYDLVSQKYKEKFNLVWLEPTDVNNSQALVTTKKVAEKYGVTTLSKLAEVAPKLRLAAVPEFEERDDGLKGLQKFYGGFQFKSVQLFDYGIKYRVILNDEADVTVGFTTDGDLTNEELVLLEDDKKFWPPYYVAPVIREETLEKDPKIEEVLNKVSKHLNNKVVQNLNAEVDIQKREYTEVAKEFLEEKGIIKK
jgi:osmoprotectant transport system substrate-binding protein